MARLSDLYGRKSPATSVSSGGRGKPAAELLARAEALHPGIEKEIGLSSAALRAGQIVRNMRKANGWTQAELAGLLGWDQERVSNIERGEGILGPTFGVMLKIAAACAYDLQFTPQPQAQTVLGKGGAEAEEVEDETYAPGPFASP